MNRQKTSQALKLSCACTYVHIKDKNRVRAHIHIWLFWQITKMQFQEDFIIHLGPYYSEFFQLHVENIPPHCTLSPAYEGVCPPSNESRGNGLFNLASELGWILWLRIWRCHFHTLRKWWFYMCWLSPCVKRLSHHCQRQMPKSPSCHTKPLPRSLVTPE